MRRFAQPGCSGYPLPGPRRPYISFLKGSDRVALFLTSFLFIARSYHDIMFGIGLPELILILAVALIVVGPDKLPELAKSLGKGIVELKKAASTLKDSLDEEDEKSPDWSGQDAEKHPNKLLEAYKDLPENALVDKFEPAFPEKPVIDSESASTEEISGSNPEDQEEDTEETKSDA